MRVKRAFAAKGPLYTFAKRGLESICVTDTEAGMRWRETTAAHKLHRTLSMRGFALSRTVSHSPRKPYCDSPVLVGLRGKCSVEFHSVESSLFAPCRRCAKCLQFRQARWRQRAAFELAAAKRSWMVTLTFSPVQLAGCLLRAKDGSEKAVEASCYADVQRYLKRLRKAVPLAKLRYLAVFERGETTGRAHYHLLLHEVGERPVTKAVLEAQWASFVHARLVNGIGAASYVTKYLTKSIDTRPRASGGYGSFVLDRKNAPSILSSLKEVYDAPPPLPVCDGGGGSDFERGEPNGGEQSYAVANRARSAELFEAASVLPSAYSATAPDEDPSTAFRPESAGGSA